MSHDIPWSLLGLAISLIPEAIKNRNENKNHDHAIERCSKHEGFGRMHGGTVASVTSSLQSQRTLRPT